ncbi:MAG: FAD-binding protein [Chloroflexota bacterium]|nr:FAD-binding protein [Chloroflexota bacterium]
MSTEVVQEVVRARAAAGAPLRIRGAAGWLDAGRPVNPNALPLSLAGDDAIVEYVAGDLTLTARAGTTLGDIARVTGGERQWLALDPYGSSGGTLGATIATASSGPLAGTFGTPRDAVLGLEVVTGAGEIVRTGGRVVKNVAGFDLTRLFTGAWGTLAVITEVTVRLRARPERDETIALPLPADPSALEGWLTQLRALPLAALALELVNGPLARALALGDDALLMARLGGNDEAVRAQRQTIRAFAEMRDAPSSVWTTLAAIEPPSAAVARVSAPPSRLYALWMALAAGDDASLAHASTSRGILRCIHPRQDDAALAQWLGRIARCEGMHIFERLPPAAWRDVPSHVNDRLSRGVRDAFDPARVLNRGILGEAA